MVYIYLADGFEEVEAITLYDLFKRAGIDFKTVSIMGKKEIEAAHGLKVYADILFEDADPEECEMMVLPGGMPGSKYLSSHEGLIAQLKSFIEDEKWVAAICAAPALVLCGNNLIAEKRATCFPGMKGKMTGAFYHEDKVVIHDKLITSRGPATAMAFALEIIKQLKGDDVYNEVADGLLFNE